MARITIDGTTYEVSEGQNLLQACLELELNLPYFCWHPALGSVGACRQCAVLQYQNPEDQRGRLTMACMTPVSDGLLIGLTPKPATDFRAGIIESLMTNHPHDCPVCEEGGECHLQDMTVMSGHHRRRFRGRKRTFQNQDLGPFINHEMNRCITCFRCVRYYRDYAGGSDLSAFASRNRTYFGRVQSGPLESEFSGNLVEVCPTGVFTDRTLSAHYSRKWDLQQAPSLCPHCAVGCNTSPGERYGTLKRIQNRFHPEINGHFLCDRGRFGYGFVNHPQRPKQAWQREAGSEQTNSLSQEQATQRLAQVLDQYAGKLIGIGSPRASLENNLALRTLVGEERFATGLSRNEAQLLNCWLSIVEQGAFTIATLQQMELADATLVLGEDPTHTAPRVALSLRQAAQGAARQRAEQLGIPVWQAQAVQNLHQDKGNPLFLLTPTATRLDDIALVRYRHAPDELARLGFAIAHCLDSSAPAVEDLDDSQQQLAQQIAEALAQAKHPLIVSGSGALHEPLLRAAAQITQALSAKRTDRQPPWFSFSAPECNSLGAALLAGPKTMTLEDAFSAVNRGDIKAAIVLENDLFRRAAPGTVEALYDGLEQLVVLDHIPQETLKSASLMLPTTSFAESGGTWVNQEGRAQYHYPVFQQTGIQSAWRWLSDACRCSKQLATSPITRWQRAKHPLQACAQALSNEALAQLLAADLAGLGPQPIPRQPHRYSGRTAMHAHLDVHEPKTPVDEDYPFSYSMEGASGMRLSKVLKDDRNQALQNLQPFAWAPGWNSNQASHRFQDAQSSGHGTGLRLLQPGGHNSATWEDAVPKKWQPSDDQLNVVALSQIFGGEEQSALAGPIAERTPVPFALFNPEDATRLSLTAGGETGVCIGQAHFRLRVRLDPELPSGLIGIPLGLGPLQGIELPALARIEPPGDGALITSDQGAQP